ncbi:MAG TPA: DUF2306 domain-containing protein [Cellvibrio sp.]|nr:DUF2306 domain-containing protein [Cellvibrio sp.]
MNPHTEKQNVKKGIGLAIVLLLLGSVAIASALSRLADMQQAIATGVVSTNTNDAVYIQHLALSLLHLIPGTLFLMLGPMQFMPGLRARRPALHRWSGRLFVVSGFTVAISAIIINIIFPPVGGWFKSASVYIFSSLMIFALGMGFRAILRREIDRHREWMIRAFAIGLGVSTMRLYFIPAYLLYGMPDNFTIGLGMWIGFGVNLLVAEWIIWRMKQQRRLA